MSTKRQRKYLIKTFWHLMILAWTAQKSKIWYTWCLKTLWFEYWKKISGAVMTWRWTYFISKILQWSLDSIHMTKENSLVLLIVLSILLGRLNSWVSSFQLSGRKMPSHHRGCNARRLSGLSTGRSSLKISSRGQVTLAIRPSRLTKSRSMWRRRKAYPKNRAWYRSQ